MDYLPTLNMSTSDIQVSDSLSLLFCYHLIVNYSILLFCFSDGHAIHILLTELKIIFGLRHHAGPESCRIDPICSVARWHKRPLNQALVSFGFVCSYVRARFTNVDQISVQLNQVQR